MPSYKVEFAIDDKDIAEMQSALAAMAPSEFAAMYEFREALKNTGLGSWLKGQLDLATAIRSSAP